jgi:hypothetical protein
MIQAPTYADPKGPILGALARFVLIGGGGALLGAGLTFYLLRHPVPPVSFGGAVTTIGGLAWSLWQKLHFNTLLDAAIRAPARNPSQPPKGSEMPLSQTIDAGIAAVEAFFGHLPPEIQADAAKAASDLRTAATNEADALITQQAPAFAPELVPLFGQFLDTVEADAKAKLDAIAKARAAVAPAS